jgi:hypothetical protein
MAEKKTTPITIDGKEYVFEDMTQEQQYLFENCIDLDRKIGSAAFNIEQLKVGKEAFLARLKTSLEAPKEAEAVEVVETVQ